MIRSGTGVLAVCLALAAPAGYAQELVVAITATAPSFSQRGADGELSGFNVDLVRAICARLGRTCRLEATPFPEIIPGVAAGRADLGVGNTLKTPERERQVAFTVPYWRSTSSFLGPRAAATGFRPEAALAEARVCVVRETRQAAHVVQLAGRDGHGRVMALPGNADVLAALRGGQCAYAFLPTMQALPFLQSVDGAAYAFLGTPESRDGLGGDVHMVVRPDQPELLRQINRALDELIRDGTHERLSRRHFPFSIL